MLIEFKGEKVLCDSRFYALVVKKILIPTFSYILQKFKSHVYGENIFRGVGRWEVKGI